MNQEEIIEKLESVLRIAKSYVPEGATFTHPEGKPGRRWDYVHTLISDILYLSDQSVVGSEEPC